MTLKEKFNEKISYPFSESREHMKILKNENNVECEKITEEFTTEFARHHVKEVLKAASESTLLYDFKKEIIESYPLTNIK